MGAAGNWHYRCSKSRCGGSRPITWTSGRSMASSTTTTLSSLTPRAVCSKRSIRQKNKGRCDSLDLPATRIRPFHLQMLDLGYPLDTVQMPLNPFDASFHSFEKQVL